MNSPGFARFEARPPTVVADALPPGMHKVSQPNGFPGRLHIPAHDPGTRLPIAVLFHGATGHAERTIEFVRERADTDGVVLYAPQAAGRTWDVLEGGYGRDIEAVDAGLRWVFERVAVDPLRVAAAGFSDGASYALSVGVTNGDLFTHILAWSPGFIAHPTARGKPPIIVSHGTQDRVLPIDRCSRVLVPRLRDAGYEVTYYEFDGPHTLPPEIAEASVRWVTGSTG